MTWLEVLFAVALAMFAAGLINGDAREGRAVMCAGAAILVTLLLFFRSDIIAGLL